MVLSRLVFFFLSADISRPEHLTCSGKALGGYSSSGEVPVAGLSRTRVSFDSCFN